MSRLTYSLLTVGLLTLISATASAQDRPYQPAYPQQPDQTNGARIYVPPQLHPQVAVSRTLAAQPVHPHMVQVSLGGAAYSGQLTTWIDPLARIQGEGKLDENHSLVKSQRLYNGLRGTTTEQISAVRNDSLQRQPRGAGANQARMFVPPLYRRFMQATGRQMQTVIIPNPAMPQQTQPQKRFDIKVKPEHPRPAKDEPMLVKRSVDK